MSKSKVPAQLVCENCKTIQLPISPEIAEALIFWRKREGHVEDDDTSLVMGAWWAIVASMLRPFDSRDTLNEVVAYAVSQGASGIDCLPYIRAWIAAEDKENRTVIAQMEYLESVLGVEKLSAMWDVAKKVSEAKLPVKPQHEPSNTLSATIEAMLVSKKAAGRRDIYLTSLRQYLELFARGREFIDIGDIGVTEIEEWFAGRTEAPSTRNSNLGRLSALFDFAWRRGYISENPCRRVEAISVVREAPAILSVDQCRQAMEWAHAKRPRMLAWLSLTLLVGLRPESEADHLTWEDIDLGRRTVHVKAAHSKLKTHRIIELDKVPSAIEWLRFAKEIGSPLPLPYASRRRFLMQLRDHLQLEVWPQDVLRHTAASYLFAFHQDAGRVAALLGNSAAILLKHYRALVQREDAERFFAILPPRAGRQPKV